MSASVDEPMVLPALQPSITHAPVPMNDRFTVHLYESTSWQLQDTLELESN